MLAIGATLFFAGRAPTAQAEAIDVPQGGNDKGSAPIPAANLASASLSASADRQLPAPAFRAQKLNPTGRAVVLTVPAKDGGSYLGDLPVQIDVDDRLTFPAARVIQILSELLAPDVLESLRTSFGAKVQVSAEDLAPVGIGVDYDPRTLELRFSIPTERRASRAVSVSALDRSRLGELMKPANFSAYVNLRGSMDLVEDGFDQGLRQPVMLLDGAVRLGPVVAESDAIWQPGALGGDFQRLGSRLVFDETKHLLRVSAGDLETQARGFQSAPDIAGISIFRSYSVLNPQQVVRPRGDRAFRLDRASTVEVVVNGQQVRRLQLAPGNYNLRDFPFTQGGNDIRLNILDDTGRTEVVQFNLFVDQTQLAKGLSEFGLYAGVKAPLGLRGPRYSDDWIASGYYRRGISDAITLGVNFQADADSRMGGVEAVIGTPIGTIGTNVSFSKVDGLGSGHAFNATFQRLIQRPNGLGDTFNLFLERRSRRFAPVSFFLADNPYKYELGGGYTHAFSASLFGGFDARFSKGRGGRPDVHNYRMSAGWRFSDRATLNAEARYQEDSLGREFSGFLSLIVRLGRYSTVRSEFDTRDNRFRSSYQTLSGSGVGSYNVTADVERSDNGAGVSVNANYFANRAELGFSHFGTYTRGFGDSQNQRSTFRLGTSLALADGAVSVGRPIFDSFAIVRPHRSLGKADVMVDATTFGRAANTGALRSATMPSLPSYSERTVALDVKNAAPGTDIGQGTFRVFPAYRSGYVVTVGSDYNVTALGVMIDVDGQPVSLVSGTATEVAHPDRPARTVFTNRQGRFGATGLAPGKWRIEMLDAARSTFEIEIPRDATGVVQLGNIKSKESR
ncbi:fimbria/pilus outer membrane usher protein [Novosphingobium jiangmenense]|uniref:Fimbrial biogenesis outer membrane usher protein n=1 Tax=Novosphingobium jiangmenense TaxID=2791981 RepID=A0ABS0HGX8_9SPHN|nr:fimbria/pilus outer membrane usher protein [Novosphingobium jiangmenense]MBF9151515.1 fimbrial biogenesis outer membrane usher protein [Novosphingobium jiangmenense]